MEALLGKTLLTKSGSQGATATLLKEKDMVALYFSASWCPPCKGFTPVLADFYGQFATREKLEIIYVSSDRTATDFVAYYKKMPWLALPNDEEGSKYKAELATKLRVQGIPTLIVLDVKTGLFISADARSQVQTAAGNTAKSQQVIAAWKATIPVAIEEGLAAAGGGSGLTAILKQIVMAVLKNPMYIFGTIYLVKWLMRKMAAAKGGDVAPTIEEYHEPIPDDEF
jgi:nucleoredoxin